jgi:hypothetical protein
MKNEAIVGLALLNILTICALTHIYHLTVSIDKKMPRYFLKEGYDAAREGKTLNAVTNLAMDQIVDPEKM